MKEIIEANENHLRKKENEKKIYSCKVNLMGRVLKHKFSSNEHICWYQFNMHTGFLICVKLFWEYAIFYNIFYVYNLLLCDIFFGFYNFQILQLYIISHLIEFVWKVVSVYLLPIKSVKHENCKAILY